MDPEHALTTLKTPHLFLFAGEASGDLIGAKLLHELFLLRPNLSVTAVAGPAMRDYPIKTLVKMEEFQVMGFLDVLLALPKILKLFKFLKHHILNNPPDAVVLIDYPGFNLRMAKHLKTAGFNHPLIHYVCPSVWAWKKGRVHTMSQTLTLLLSIFPFERQCFSTTSLPVEFIGHPLAEAVMHHTPNPTFPPFPKPIFAIFPGSRKKEVQRNLPLQLQAAIDLGYERYSIVISCAQDHLLPVIQRALSKYPAHTVHILPAECNYDLMHHTSIAFATSGTITLELALHKVPTLVTYALTSVDFFLATKVLRIHLPHYCIVNYTAGMRIFPEFYGPDFNQNMIYETLSVMLNTSEELDLCRARCSILKTLLYEPPSSRKAATLILANTYQQILSGHVLTERASERISDS